MKLKEDEAATRETQIKSMLGIIDDTPITGEQLKYMKDNFVRLTGMDNKMQLFSAEIIDGNTIEQVKCGEYIFEIVRNTTPYSLTKEIPYLYCAPEPVIRINKQGKKFPILKADSEVWARAYDLLFPHRNLYDKPLLNEQILNRVANWLSSNSFAEGVV